MTINISPKEVLNKTAIKISLVVTNWDKTGYPLADSIIVSYSLQDNEGSSIMNDTLSPSLIEWDRTLDWIFNKCIQTLNLEKA